MSVHLSNHLYLLLANLVAWISVYLPVFFLPASSLPACLFTYLAIFLVACLDTCLPGLLACCLSTCLTGFYLSACPTVCLSSCTYP